MTPAAARMLGEAPAFLNLMDEVSRVAPIARSVLIIGERGTGKEMVASRLHYLSERWGQPYVQLNCASLTDSLLESELFGHEQGAFSGAARRHQGFLERADGGTLFLDELATAAAPVQEKLLRVLEYGEFYRVGGSAPVTVDVRIVAATNVDLRAEVAAGRLRADLLDRLAFEVLTLPPLRARPEDILLLAEHFAVGMCKLLGRALFPGFTPEAAATLLQHHWPGNVRELKNAVERSVARTPAGEEVDTVVIDAFASPYAPAAPTPIAPAIAAREPEPASPPADLADLSAHGGLEGYLAEQERAALLAALAAARHNQRRAAQLLGLSYDKLRRRLAKYQL